MAAKKKINNDEINLIEAIKIIAQNKFQILTIIIILLINYYYLPEISLILTPL